MRLKVAGHKGYGNKTLALTDRNAVFVKTLKDVKGALLALKAAAEDSELDEVIEIMMNSRKT